MPLIAMLAGVPLMVGRTLGLAVLRAGVPLARAAGRIVARQALGFAMDAGRQELAAAQADAQRALGSFRVRAVVTVDNRASEVGRAIREAAVEAVYRTAEELVSDAQTEAPVRTGRLRDSIRIVERTERSATVGRWRSGRLTGGRSTTGTTRPVGASSRATGTGTGRSSGLGGTLNGTSRRRSGGSGDG